MYYTFWIKQVDNFHNAKQDESKTACLQLNL